MAGARINIPKGMERGVVTDALRLLASLEVLVGFPEDTTTRAADATEPGKREPTNAELGYIHDNGAPERNIPQREFMRPAIREVEGEVADLLGATARAVMRGGGETAVQTGLTQVGFKVEVAIKRKINEGVPPPLADATVRQRMRKGRRNGAGARKGAAIELDRRWDGQVPSVEFAKPLVDTGAMRNAVKYVIRPRSARRR